jgi:hypothetical protein
MIRERSRLFRNSLRGGGIGGLGDNGDSVSEMDWETGEDPKSAPAPGTTSTTGGTTTSGGWAANPFPASTGGTGSAGSGVTPPPGLTPDQLVAWSQNAIAAGQTIATTVVPAVQNAINSVAASSGTRAPIIIPNLQALSRTLLQRYTVRTPAPAPVPASSTQVVTGGGNETLLLVGAAAAAAGLGYFLLTRKGKKK